MRCPQEDASWSAPAGPQGERQQEKTLFETVFMYIRNICNALIRIAQVLSGDLATSDTEVFDLVKCKISR